MELSGKVVVVTGAARGIGRALAVRFAQEGARGVVVADLDPAACHAVAGELGDVGLDVATDVTVEGEVRALVARAEERFGGVDLFCANAGIATGQGIDAPDEVWDRIWAVNVKAHVYAARAILPGYKARGGGYLLTTASAAGLLTNLGDAPYSVTKHAAVALAEYLAITYADAGLKVSCLCPQGVKTDMLFQGMTGLGNAAAEVVSAQGAIEPEDVAEAVIQGLAAEQFLILPHPEVAEYYRRRATDPDRWQAGMGKLQRMFFGGAPPIAEPSA